MKVLLAVLVTFGLIWVMDWKQILFAFFAALTFLFFVGYVAKPGVRS